MSSNGPQEQFNRRAVDADLYHKKFVEYIQNHVKIKNDADVKHLLEAYVHLANCYYQQFRQSLLTKLQTLDEDRVALATAVDSRQKKPVIAALKKASEAAELEYNQLRDQIPILLQEALSKLAAEWGRVYQVVVASREAHNEMIGFMAPLISVVRTANYSVGIDANKLSVIPQIGSEYALQFFNYADNFMVLSMPIFTLNAPWEWSIIWHEMAGYLVRQLKESEFEIVNQRLAQQVPYKQAFGRASQRLLQLKQADPQSLNLVEKELGQHADTLIENMTALAAVGLGHSVSELQVYISQEDGYQTNDRILDFHTQLQALRDEILRERGPDAYKEFLDYGWCDDWLEELFEDAFSARFFGWPFLGAFDRILSRFEDGGKELRHPSRRVRILMAKKIIELTHPTDLAAIPNKTLPKLTEDFTIEDKVTKRIITWKVKNNTDRTWGKGYWLKFVRGTVRPFRGKSSIPKAKPGDILEIPISLQIPDEPGEYFGEWCFVDDEDTPFGIVTVSFSMDVKEIPLENYMISLVANRIYRSLSLLARQTNDKQLDNLKEYTDLINDSVPHTVQPGDNLYRIGLQYGISWQELVQLNNLENPNMIDVGQKIIVLKPLPSVEEVERLWKKKLAIPSSNEAQGEAEAQAQAIGEIIGKAMKSWVKVNVTEDDDAKMAQETIEKLKKFPSEISAAKGADVNEPGIAVTEPNSFIERVKKMDYTELLSLKFTDVDFLDVNFVTIALVGSDKFKVDKRSWNSLSKTSVLSTTAPVKGFVIIEHLLNKFKVDQRSWNSLPKTIVFR